MMKLRRALPRRWRCGPVRAARGSMLGLALLAAPRPAAAWDPQTTHLAVLDHAVAQGPLHVRWMRDSDQELGIFSSLRLDPDRLNAEERRLVSEVIGAAPASAGALPRGGPGACPPPGSPLETTVDCISGDLWEQSAIAWMRLGSLAEVTPTWRHQRHFLDPEDRGAMRWQDPRVGDSWSQLIGARTHAEPGAGVVTGTNFQGKGPTALAHFQDGSDLLSPSAFWRHREHAMYAQDPIAREHHLVMALLCAGALSHVVQDLGLPSHSRADALAFFTPVSDTPGDYGHPLQEYVRARYGRHGLRPLLSALPLNVRQEAAPNDLESLLVGQASLSRLSAGRFFSPHTLPASVTIDEGAEPQAAARALLGDKVALEASELDGATLSPWPADRGYLLSGTGRPLLAWTRDELGMTTPYLDENVYRESAAQLLPHLVRATDQLFDLLFPGGEARVELSGAGSIATVQLPAGWSEAQLDILREDADGTRHPVQRLLLKHQRSRVVGLPVPDQGRSVLVLRARRGDAEPVLMELRLPRVSEGAAE